MSPHVEHRPSHSNSPFNSSEGDDDTGSMPSLSLDGCTVGWESSAASLGGLATPDTSFILPPGATSIGPEALDSTGQDGRAVAIDPGPDAVEHDKLVDDGRDCISCERGVSPPNPGAALMDMPRARKTAPFVRDHDISSPPKQHASPLSSHLVSSQSAGVSSGDYASEGRDGGDFGTPFYSPVNPSVAATLRASPLSSLDDRETHDTDKKPKWKARTYEMEVYTDDTFPTDTSQLDPVPPSPALSIVSTSARSDYLSLHAHTPPPTPFSPYTPYSPFSPFATLRAAPLTELEMAVAERDAARAQVQRMEKLSASTDAHVQDIEGRLNEVLPSLKETKEALEALKAENAELKAQKRADEAYIDRLERAHEYEHDKNQRGTRASRRNRKYRSSDVDTMRCDMRVSHAEVAGLTAETRIDALSRKMNNEDVGVCTRPCACDELPGLHAVLAQLTDDFAAYRARTQVQAEHAKRTLAHKRQQMDEYVARSRALYSALLAEKEAREEDIKVLSLRLEKTHLELELARHNEETLRRQLQTQQEAFLRQQLDAAERHDGSLENARAKGAQRVANIKALQDRVARMSAKLARPVIQKNEEEREKLDERGGGCGGCGELVNGANDTSAAKDTSAANECIVVWAKDVCDQLGDSYHAIMNGNEDQPLLQPLSPSTDLQDGTSFSAKAAGGVDSAREAAIVPLGPGPGRPARVRLPIARVNFVLVLGAFGPVVLLLLWYLS